MALRRSSYLGYAIPELDEEPVEVKRPPRSSCSRFCDRVFPAGFVDESKRMFTLTWPICVTQVCQMIMGPISLIFCGHLNDPIILDGAALAMSMINVTCVSVGQGMGTACDTFFSQSFGGRNKRSMGLYMQRAVLIFLLAVIVCITLSINMELFLRLVGQDPEVSRLVGEYMLIFIPAEVSFFMYVVLAKFIQNQNIVLPNVVIGIFANAVNAILHYVLLYHFNYGTNGSAVAQTCAFCLMFLMTLAYILIFKKYKDTWGGWSLECLQGWGQFCKLAIPGMLMVCMEWWGFEIGVFLTGLLGTTYLGAQSVLLQLDAVWFQVPLGIQIAASIRIGQYMGSGSKDGAITAARLGILAIFILSVFMSILFLALRYQLPYIFTNVEPVAQLVGDLLPIVTLYIFFDGLACACKGVLYGTGRQILGAALLFISYYCLALPIGVPLMFLTDLRSAAYWWALAFNLMLQAGVLVLLVWRTNWDKQIEKAQERAGLLGEEDVFGDTTETDCLISGNETRRRSRAESRHRLLSVSLTTTEIKTLVSVPEPTNRRKLILSRLLVVLVMLSILGAGVAVRLLVPIPEAAHPADNNTTTPASTDASTLRFFQMSTNLVD